MKKVVWILTVFLSGIVAINAQSSSYSIPLIGEEAPSFIAQSTNGRVDFPRNFGKSWKVILSHPRDFTPVCSSELLELAYMQEEFKEMDVKIIVLSVDDLKQHFNWKEAIEKIAKENNRPVRIEFPLVEDSDLQISVHYGMLHKPVSTSRDVRGVFVIDPNNKVRSVQFYPDEIGRSFKELKRSIIALQTVDEDKNILTPANWEPGDDVLLKALSKKEEFQLKSNTDIYKKSWFLFYKSHKPKVYSRNE